MTPGWTPFLSALALATLVASGCAHPSIESHTRSNAMSEQIREDNKHTVRRLFETFNGADLAAIDSLVGPEYVGAQGGQGPAGFKAVVVGLRAAFPDLHYTLDDVMAEGDQVAVRWHWTGTHRAAFRGFPPTGKPVTNTGAGIFRVATGKVVAAVLETDRLGFLEQIGAVPEGVGRGPRPPATSSP
jgi:predicted ester cyclase